MVEKISNQEMFLNKNCVIIYPYLQVLNYERRGLVVKSIIQKSINYIDKNVKTNISVNELCNRAGYSYEYYCRLFKQYVGFSPAEFITRRKLIYAVFEMSQGKSKTAVAFDFGYDTYAGFYKAFKREYNCSPSEFIKNHKSCKPYKINILQEEHIMVSKEKIKSILKQWDINDFEIRNIINENTGRQSDNAYYIGDDYVIKFTANLGYIMNSININKSLSNTDIKTAQIVKTISNDDYIQDGELYYMLTKRILGKQLSCDEIFNDTSIAVEIGKNIAKLHIALSNFDASNYEIKNLYEEALTAIPYVQNKCNLSGDFISRYKQEFGDIYNSLPKQVIHRDINPSNMLFDNGDFKGFVDFDLSEVNIRIFDICYPATAILSESFSEETDIAKWKEILNNIIAGYDSISTLSDEEKSAIPYVIYSIQIICINYFSKFEKFQELTDTNIQIFKWLMTNL